MLRRSLLATRAVRAVRSYRRQARHHALVKANGLALYESPERTDTEARARDLCRRVEESVSWAPRPLYPVGGAAGPLLLYLLIRALEDLPARRVLELGAGQTTRLLGGWSQAEPDRRVVTFEHDEWWAGHVREEVSPETSCVLHLAMEPCETPAGPGQWYAAPPGGAVPDEGFDLAVVDGPVGTDRFSRYGIVPRLLDWLAPEWGMIWDDLDRPGDLESFAAFIGQLREAGVAHDHRLLRGDQVVGVVYTPGYRALQYMW